LQHCIVYVDHGGQPYKEFEEGTQHCIVCVDHAGWPYTEFEEGT